MDIDWDVVTHVTKVDPAKPLPSDPGVLEGTDLIVVGGSDGVTGANVLETIRAVRSLEVAVPVLQEPYSAGHVSRETIERADGVAVPVVYNGDREHFVGKHLDLFTEIGRKPEALFGADVPLPGEVVTSGRDELVPDLASNLVGEGYVVQHLESAAADRAGVEDRYTPDQVAGAALATESLYDFPIFYIEYSGTYGGPADVEAAARYLEETILLYGGGIDSREKAEAILEAGANAIVVGDCFHDDPDAFCETIPR